MRTVGLIEPVVVVGKKRIKVLGKFDTGAFRTSIDEKVAKEAGFRAVGKVKTKSALSKGRRRKLVKAKIQIGNKIFDVEASVSKREHSVAKVLIGRDILFKNFVVDVSKRHSSPKERDFKI